MWVGVDKKEYFSQDDYMTRKKVGLALGSGGARGLSHIGVIKKLLENNINIDFIAGSSVGALIGGLYSAIGDINKVEEMAESFNWGDWFKTFSDPALGTGILRGEKAEEHLRELVKNQRIEDLKIKMAAVATDLNTAESVVIKQGDLSRAVRASGSIPLLFQPEEIDGRMLVDGGLSCPVPVEALKEMGAEKIIAVNLDSVYFLPSNRINKVSNVFSIMRNSLFLMKYHLAGKEVKTADIVISPEIPYVMDLDFVHKKEIIQGGEAATEKMIPEIKKLFLD